MSAVTSLSQQSQLAENAYLSLTGAIRGRGNVRSGAEIHDDNGYHDAFFASQSRSPAQAALAGEERGR